MKRRYLGQTSLVGLLVAILIISILMYVFLPKYLKSGSPTRGLNPETPTSSTEVKATIQRQYGGSPECVSNLNQIRMAIQSYESMNSEKPASLGDLKSIGVTPEISKCGVTRTPYNYDPSSGRVWCTTPGHEKY